MPSASAATPGEGAHVRDLGCAFAGALAFNIPLLMTMEIWELGVVMEHETDRTPADSPTPNPLEWRPAGQNSPLLRALA